jgi:hypothetical protein
MRSNNDHEAITHLAMPERQIPVLIDSTLEKSEGFVPSIAWSDKPVTNVRRLLPQFVQGLASPQRRLEIEKEHGTISTTEWDRLRELLGLRDRLNAGDWSPVITSNAEEILKDFSSRLDRLSPGGWFVLAGESGTGKQTLRSASGDVQLTTSIEIAPVGGIADRKAAARIHPVPKRDGRTAQWSAKISGVYKTAPYALSEAFTAGLSKTRFVVWWSHVGNKLVPGLYYIVTALFALAQRTAMGDLSEMQQRLFYCSHKCQVAAGMRRYRATLELKAKAKSKTTTKGKKQAGRK